MKLLAIVSSVLALMLTAGAVVLVQQSGYDIPGVMGWKTEPAADGEAQPSTAADQPDHQPDAQSAGGTATQTAEVESARQSGDATSEKEDAVETAVAALGDLNLSPGKKSDSGNQRSTFDVARINPDGVSVFAGQGKPFQFVSVLADGVRLGTAKVDENGEWVLVTEKKLASADPELSIEVGSALADFEDLVESGTGESGETAADASGLGANDVDAAASSGTRVAALSPGAKQNELTPTVREINERMLNDLQKMVDGAARDETATETPEPASSDVADEPAAENATAEKFAAESMPNPSVAPAGPRAENRDEPQKVAIAATSAAPRPDDAKTVPIPVQFVYREAKFTEDGEKAASLLLQYVKLGKLPAVTLSGHADERGSPAWNMQLSKDRLDTVEEYLRSGGYKGRLILLPKGETEPYEGINRASLAAEDLFQLDRRVELHLDQ